MKRDSDMAGGGGAKSFPLSLRIQLLAIGLLSPILWLPVVRGLLQPDYQWGLFGLSGKGTGGDYAALLGVGTATALLVYLAWRRPEWTAVRLGLIAWFAGATALLAAPALRGDGLILQGDTLGIRMNLSWTAAAFFGSLLVLSISSAASTLRAGRPWFGDFARTAWSLRRRSLAIAGGLALIQVPCLAFGALHGRANQIGVVATIVQALALAAALRAPRRTGRAEGAMG